MKYLLILMLSVNTLYAQDAAIIKKGEKSPIDGVVISERLAKDLDKSDRLVVEYRELARLDKELLEKQREKISSLERKETVNVYKNIGYFLMGVLTTSLVVKAVK